MAISIGDSFSTFVDVEVAIKRHEEYEGITYWKRDSRTLEAAKKRKKGLENVNPALKYFEVKYTCVKGGRDYKSGSTGQRPNQRTFRESCEAQIHFHVSEDGQTLVVRKMIAEHSHEINKAVFPFLPKQRRLDESEQQELNTILQIRPNKKILQDHIRKTTGKMVTLRDLTNHNLKLTEKVSDLGDMLKDIVSSDNKTVRVLTTDGILEAIYYQDETMKQKYRYFPEVLMVDATYKLNDMRMPVFLQLVIDGNGESEIVSVFVVVTESAETISKLLAMFKEENDAWTNTKTIMTDKDLMERQVYGTNLPDAQLQLCLFHVLRSMKREINTEKMNIRMEQKDHCLELLLKIAYSASKDDYETNVGHLVDTNVTPVIDYYMAQWHPIRTEWVTGLKDSCHYNNQTNNRLESINQKLKQVINKFSNLKKFFDDLEIILGCLRQERDSRSANVFWKRSVIQYPAESAELKYSTLLTPHAFTVVKKELMKGKNIIIEDAHTPVTLQTSRGEITVTLNHCTCSFAVINQLPCRHLFAVRQKLDKDLYSEENVADRWTMLYYRNAASIPMKTDHNNKLSVTVDEIPRRKHLSQSQKYKIAFLEAQKLATYSSEVSMEKFQRRVEVLKNLVALWQDDKEGAVVEIVEEVVLVEPVESVQSDIDNGREQLENLQAEAVSVEPVGNVQASRQSIIHSGMEQLEHLQAEAARVRHELENGPGDMTESVQALEKQFTQLRDSIQITHSSSPHDENNLSTKHINPEASSQLSTVEVDLSESSDMPGSSRKVLSSIQLPPTMRKRGRPKGVHQSAIGLGKKRCERKPVPFWKKTPTDKDRYMLRWFVSAHSAEMALLGTTLESSRIKNADDVSCACKDDNVDFHRMKRFFSPSGWKTLLSTIEKKVQCDWSCVVCESELQGEQVGCDSCLQWFHFSCVGLKKAPKSRKWFCTSCFNNSGTST